MPTANRRRIKTEERQRSSLLFGGQIYSIPCCTNDFEDLFWFNSSYSSNRPSAKASAARILINSVPQGQTAATTFAFLSFYATFIIYFEERSIASNDKTPHFLGDTLQLIYDFCQL